ncbi:MAG: hypothetical protein MUO23_07120 [Anaerolineales bacterium]|nr:hypothetical protein [Anaerolineales bacterium]
MALGAGLVILGMAAVDRLLASFDRRLTERSLGQRVLGIPPEETSEPIDVIRHSALRLGLLVPLFVLILFTYLGQVTVWRWQSWPGSSYRYHGLAEAFARGEVALLTQPSPALAELDNPYDPEARGGIEVLGDLSYFDGRYYMYWGPTPAALSSLWLLIGGTPISDDLIVLLSVSAVFCFSALAVLHLQREYFPGMPLWLVLGGLVLVATAHPALWTLNSPSLYTAAISSGQAFFIGGLYFMLTALNAPQPTTWRYLACGTFWALAIGCRLTLLVAVLPLVLMAITMRMRAQFGSGKVKKELRPMAGLLMPLAIGCVILGVYNFARFGDLLETGFRYQMMPYDQVEAMRRGLVFNPRYLIPNLLHYLAAPIRLIPEFPFLRPWWGAYPPFSAFLSRFSVPLEYSVQNAVGLTFVTPALLLGGLLLMDAFSCPSSRGQNALDARGRSADSMTLRELALALSVSGLALAGPVLLYRVSATRFLMEVTPAFAVLSALGAFTLHKASRLLPGRRIAVTLLIASLIALSAAIGFVLALNGDFSRFDDANPALYSLLVNLFSR